MEEDSCFSGAATNIQCDPEEDVFLLCAFPPCYLYTQQKPTTWPLTTVTFVFWMASKQINQWQGMYTGIPQRISLFIQQTLVLSCPNNISLKYMLFQV